jgi:alcohol dehydrogenase
VRAAYYEAFGGAITLREVPAPEPPPGGVVLRVGATGLCRSDWHGWMGHDADIRLPHVPGHELAGTIEAVGAGVERWRVGERVTVPFAVGCGRCVECRAGHPQVCDDYFQPGFTAWGAFAEYVALPHADYNLIRLPPELDFVAAASLGCRFGTAFRAVVQQGNVRGGEWVAVHGCGGVGLAAVMIAAAVGAQVVAVDIRAEALAEARAAGAHATVLAGEVAEVPAAVRALTGGGAQVSLDALGSHATCRNSILSLRKRGRHVQVGLLAGPDRDPPVPMHAVIAGELVLLGSHGLAAHAYGEMLAMIARGALRPRQLVRRTIALADVPAALRELGEFRGPGVTVMDRF